MKLLHLWAFLSPAERTEIPIWVSALQPKLRADALWLFAYLIENASENAQESDAIWSRKTLFTHLYGNDAAYNDDWLRHAQSLLVKAIEQYISAKASMQTQADAAFYIADFYAVQKEARYFQATYKQLQQQNETELPKNQDYFYRLARAENLYFRYITDGQRVEKTICRR
jgi:hypothetical protein